MRKEVSQAIAGGTISGVCFALAASGEKGTVLLSYLTPLPMLMVGFSLGFRSLLIALGLGLAACLILLGVKGTVLFLALVGIPSAIAIWFVSCSEDLKAVGNIISWLGVWALGLMVLLVLFAPQDPQGLEVLVRSTLEKGMNIMAPELPLEFRQNFALSQAKFFPATALSGWEVVLFANGLLARKILRRFGLDLFPSFNVKQMCLPDWPIFVLVASIAIMLLGSGNIAYIGANAAMIMALPYLLMGFSAVHSLVRQFAQPKMLLWAFYLGFTMVSAWGIFMVAGLGLVEHIARKNGIPVPGSKGEA